MVALLALELSKRVADEKIDLGLATVVGMAIRAPSACVGSVAANRVRRSRGAAARTEEEDDAQQLILTTEDVRASGGVTADGGGQADGRMVVSSDMDVKSS